MIKRSGIDDILEHLSYKGYQGDNVLTEIPGSKQAWERLGVEYITNKCETHGTTMGAQMART